MASATLLIKGPDGSTREVVLEGELTVGRAEGNGLVLAEGGVSRKHARFFFGGDGALQVEDLGSAHGTFVGGNKLEGPAAIPPGTPVHVGDYELTVKAGGGRAASASRPGSGPVASTPRPPGARPPGARMPAPGAGAPAAGAGSSAARMPSPGGGSGAAARSRPPANGPGAGESPSGRPPRAPATAPRPGAIGPARATKLIPAQDIQAAIAVRPAGKSGPAEPPGPFPSLCGVSAPWSSTRHTLRGVISVGRQAGSDILIDDESLSRRHAELEVAPDGGVFVRDLRSANGTTIDGEMVGEEFVQLKGGEVVQFGTVGFAFDAGDVEALAAPTRRSRRATPVRRRGSQARGGGAPQTGGGEAKKKRLMLVGGGLVATILILAVAAVVMPPPDATQNGGRPGNGGPLVPVDNKTKIQGLISQCRSYSMVEFGSDPDWKKADAACDAALDLDPINNEALQLKKKIKVESEAYTYFERGSKAMSRKREEEALDQFARITKESAYFNRAKPMVVEAVAEVKRTTQNDCRRYVANNRWKEALPRCETYMALVCQGFTREELYPPIGMSLTLSARAKDGEWRPPDENYRRFLLARQKVMPDSTEWRCPEIPLFDPGDRQIDPKKKVELELAERYKDKEILAAVMRYWEGKATEAESVLTRIVGTSKRAAFHDEARNLVADISTVRQLFGNGSSLVKDKFEVSLADFEEALELDKKLIGEKLSELQPSYFRRTIHTDVARAAYENGRQFAGRGDMRKACKIWKLGFGMYKADLDLLKALQNGCTRRAQEVLASAGRCDELEMVIALAVEGDGIAEQATVKKGELNCP